MNDTKYHIQLLDNRQLSLSSNLIELHPHIQDQIRDISGNEVFLEYPDAEALHLILTTSFLQNNHDPAMYMRLVKAVDYLGDQPTLRIMFQNILNWFDNPVILEQLKPHKEEIRKIMYMLPDTMRWTMFQLYHKFLEQTQQTHDLGPNNYLILISEDFNYKVFAVHKSDNIDISRKSSAAFTKCIFYKDQQIAKITELDLTYAIITNTGYIYAEHNLVLVRYNVNTDPIVPEQILTTTKNVGDVFISRDGTKYMTNSDIFENEPPIYEMRNVIDNSLVIKGDVAVDEKHRAGEVSNSPSPPMTVVIGEIEDHDRKYFIHHIDGHKIEVQKPNIPIPTSVNEDRLADMMLTIENNQMLVDYPTTVVVKRYVYGRGYIYRFNDNEINIIFSYSGNIYMEVIIIDKELLINTFLSPSTIENEKPRDYYMIRILNTEGKVLVDSFITHERPVALSESYLLTEVKRMTSTKIYNKERTISDKNLIRTESFILVRSLTNLEGPIVQKIEPPSIALNIEIPDLYSKMREYDSIELNGINLFYIIAGAKDSYLFVYSMQFDVNCDQKYIVQYEAKSYDMEKFLDEKLG